MAAAPSARPHAWRSTARAAQPGVRSDYIVQASSTELARRAVEEAGGVVTGELDIIRAVGASLDARELAALSEKAVPGLRIYEDGAVSASSRGALLLKPTIPAKSARAPCIKAESRDAA